MTIRVVTAPSAEPVTLAEAKKHLNVDTDFTSDDAYISGLITMAREYAESITRRAYVQRTLECLEEDFCEYEFELPYPPLQSISSIKYIDVLQTVAASAYQVDVYREPGRVKPAYQQSWPTIARAEYNAVRIQYIAGYTPAGSPISDIDYAANIPAKLKYWMKSRLTVWYEIRMPIITGTQDTEIKRDYVDGLLDSLMVDTF
jgi:uncharacterized phiE125 gp8 family phage protein